MRMLRVACLTFAAIVLPLVSAHAQDAGGGERVFKSQCGICHAVAAGKNLVGPTMAGVVGRKAGTVAGFHYTDANKNSGLTWDAATLDRYLANPRATVPGTTMAYAGVKADQQRQDLIAYLSTLH
jgi:cytochrome c